MFELFDLPLEIQQQIFASCGCAHLQNLACCSSTCNAALKERLWNRLNVYWQNLLRSDCRRPTDKKRFENLKHTKFLSFSSKSESALERKCNPVKWDPKKEEANYQKVISHCDPAMVQSLHQKNGGQGGLITYACQRLTGLKVLDVSMVDNLSVDTFIAIDQLSSLVELKLENTNTEDEHLYALSNNIENLQVFNINNCDKVTAIGVTHCLKLFTELKELHLRDGGSHGYGRMKVNDDTLKTIIELQPSLRLLDIGYSRVTSEGFKNISKLKFLRHLKLDYCNRLQDADMAVIGTMTSLRTLSVNWLSINNEGVWYLSTLVDLRKLEMRKCRSVSDEAMSHLKTLKELEHLDIRDTALSDTGLKYIAMLPKLKLLMCDRFRFSADVLETLGNHVKVV